MPTFTRKQHATMVNDELREAILGPDKKAKKLLLEAMVISTKTITPKQKCTTSEGGWIVHLRGCALGTEDGASPTSHNNVILHCISVVIKTAPQTHQQNTMHNTPCITSAINRPATNTRTLPRLNPVLVQHTPDVHWHPQLKPHSLFSPPHHNTPGGS